MEVIGVIGYLLACLVLGVIVTIIIGMFRPIKKSDDFRPLRSIIGFFLFFTVLPYGFTEVLTRVKGQPMKPAVEEVMAQAEVKGKLLYYKVLWANATSAKVIGVGEEASGWSANNEHVTISMDMTLEKGKWRAKEFNVVNSFKRGKDGTTIPPYW